MGPAFWWTCWWVFHTLIKSGKSELWKKASWEHLSLFLGKRIAHQKNGKGYGKQYVSISKNGIFLKKPIEEITKNEIPDQL